MLRQREEESSPAPTALIAGGEWCGGQPQIPPVSPRSRVRNDNRVWDATARASVIHSDAKLSRGGIFESRGGFDLSPLRGWLTLRQNYPRLAPQAAGFRRVLTGQQRNSLYA